MQPHTSFAAVLRIHQSMHQALCCLPNDLSGSIFECWGWILRSAYVSQGKCQQCPYTLDGLHLGSQLPLSQEDQFMGNSAAWAPYTPPLEAVPLLKKNSTVIEPERNQALMEVSCPIRLAFAQVKVSGVAPCSKASLCNSCKTFQVGSQSISIPHLQWILSYLIYQIGNQFWPFLLCLQKWSTISTLFDLCKETQNHINNEKKNMPCLLGAPNRCFIGTLDNQQ